MLNHTIAIGRLGRDPDFRKTANGVGVSNFPLAVDSSKRSQAEAKEPVWFSCVAWDKLAEVASKTFHKGDLVYVAGQVSLHTYSTGSGEKRTVLRLNASDARVLASASRTDENSPAMNPEA